MRPRLHAPSRGRRWRSHAPQARDRGPQPRAHRPSPRAPIGCARRERGRKRTRWRAAGERVRRRSWSEQSRQHLRAKRAGTRISHQRTQCSMLFLREHSGFSAPHALRARAHTPNAAARRAHNTLRCEQARTSSAAVSGEAMLFISEPLLMSFLNALVRQNSTMRPPD